MNDVTPVAYIGETGFVMMVHPSLPAKSVKELIAYDKANPGKLSYGSSGTGTGIHLGTELFNQMAGTKMTHVPYKGAAPAMTELIGGQIQLVIGSMIGAVQHIRSNRLRGIAVTTSRRSNVAPDIPAVAETVPGYEMTGFYGVLGPKALPKEIILRWNSEINRILKLPAPLHGRLPPPRNTDAAAKRAATTDRYARRKDRASRTARGTRSLGSFQRKRLTPASLWFKPRRRKHLAPRA